jgi:hypothetical protein
LSGRGRYFFKQGNFGGRRPLGLVLDVKGDTVILLEVGLVLLGQGGTMDKDILAAGVGGYKTKALFSVVPFDGTR